jgi:hypothetical protein
MTKPTRHLQRELESFVKKNKGDPAIGDIELSLATGNPVSCLGLEDFITLLRVAIENHDFATGSSNTKTVIEMRMGLRILMGEQVSHPVFSPFDWDASFKLH